VPGSSPPSCFLFEEEDDETVSGLGSSGPDSWAATAGLRSGKCLLYFFLFSFLFYFSLFSMLCFLFEFQLVCRIFELRLVLKCEKDITGPTWVIILILYVHLHI
jgi:hypothetical protein